MSTEDLDDQLIDASIAYLLSVGIKPTVIGGISIRHDPGDPTFNHTMVVRFTAKLPDYLPANAPEVTG